MATTKKTPVAVMGTDQSDTLKNSALIEVITGGEGVDKMVFEEGTKGVKVNLKTGVSYDSFGNKDMVSGVEIIVGTSFNDSITGSDGTDYLAGGAGNDTLNGGNGNDELYGGEGDDRLSGGNGNDFLVGGKGNDALSGGAGFDTADYSDEGGAGISADMQTGKVVDTYGDTDTLSSIERIRATDFADKVYGNTGANAIEGGGGNDLLDGRNGNDTVMGGFGDDTVMGGSGNDVVVGGRGADKLDGGTGSQDMVDYSQDGGWLAVSVNLTTGLAEDSWGDLDTLAGIENVKGGELGDWIHGGKGANVLTGMGGDDVLTGGGGNDVFAFAAGHGNDRINDFNAGDKLDVSGLGVTSLEQLMAMVEGHDLGMMIRTGEGSSIVLVDVNVKDAATLGYIFA